MTTDSDIASLVRTVDRLVQALDIIGGRLRQLEKAAGIDNQFQKRDRRLAGHDNTTLDRIGKCERTLDQHHRRLAKLEGEPTSGERENRDNKQARQTFAHNRRQGYL